MYLAFTTSRFGMRYNCTRVVQRLSIVGPTRFHAFDVSAHVTVPSSTYCHTVLQYDSNILRASWLVRDDVKSIKPNRILVLDTGSTVYSLVVCSSSTVVAESETRAHSTDSTRALCMYVIHAQVAL